MRRPRVTAVIVTYQSETTIGATLSRVRECFDAGLLACVVVDNASTDNTVAILEQHADWVKTVKSRTNDGFGDGCNQGLDLVETEFTLFLNPDAEVDIACIEGLTAFMDEHSNVGACGPATIVGAKDQPTTFQNAGKRQTPWDMIRLAVFPGQGAQLMQPIIPGTEPRRVGWICGAIFLLRTELIKRIGGFDSRFFLYWEEVDVCQKVDDSGYEVWTVPGCVATHIGGVSSVDDENRMDGCIAVHYFQSRRYYMVKHHGWFAATLAEIGEFCILQMRTLLDLALGRGMRRLKPRLQAPLLSVPREQQLTTARFFGFDSDRAFSRDA